MECELYHYGVLGMKWGVRRYQNYDGSYTQRGLQRYKKAEARYDEAKAKRKAAKVNGDKETVIKQKVVMRNAKNEMNKAYKNLKMDKRADQGKRLYAEGKRMTRREVALARQMLISTGSVAVGKALIRVGVNNIAAARTMGLLTVGGTTVNIIAYQIEKDRNKKLSAYYGH